jgi:uncharacterized membrane protein YczE
MLIRRLIQLYAGLVLYGFSMALLVRSNLGVDPWDVFHQGVALHVGWSFGTVVNVTGVFVLLLWWPLRQKPGLGTISNIIVIGIVADACLWAFGTPDSLLARIAMLLSGIVLNGLAGGAYIGAGFGPGPRDGLMTAFVRRTGVSVRLVRTTIELLVLATGWLLGGTVGVGTVLYALSIGWLVQFFLALLDHQPKRPMTELAA